MPNPPAPSSGASPAGSAGAPGAQPAAKPLFRKEAVAYQADQLFGEALVITPLSLRAMALFALVAAALLLAFLLQGEYTRKVHVVGYLAPDQGFVKVYPGENGVIAKRRVQEGDTVAKDDVLYVISLDRTAGAGDVGKAAHAELTSRREALTREREQREAIGRSQLEQLTARAASLADQLKKIDRQVDLQRERLETMRQTTAQYSKLAEQGFMSKTQLQNQKALELEQEVDLQSIQVNRSAVLRDLESARKQAPEVELRTQSDLSAIDRQISALGQEASEAELRHEVLVTAPAAGTVTAIRGEPGQQANTGTPLLSILPAGAKLEAQLLAPPSAIGFIEPGKVVRLRYAAYPYQRFGHQPGVVRQVARTVVQPNELPMPGLTQEPVYVITVTPERQFIKAYGHDQPLQSGMALDADILLDTRPVWQWLFEPLLTIRGRL